MTCCWSPFAVSKPISPSLILSLSTVPLPDCLDMVERASVDAGLSILESSISPATGHHKEHPLPEPHCKMSSHLNCGLFGSQDLLPSPVVMPGCSLATHSLDPVFVLFAGSGCTDCTVSATSEASWGGQQELQHRGMSWPGKRHSLPLWLWLIKDLRKNGLLLVVHLW